VCPETAEDACSGQKSEPLSLDRTPGTQRRLRLIWKASKTAPYSEIPYEEVCFESLSRRVFKKLTLV